MGKNLAKSLTDLKKKAQKLGANDASNIDARIISMEDKIID